MENYTKEVHDIMAADKFDSKAYLEKRCNSMPSRVK